LRALAPAHQGKYCTAALTPCFWLHLLTVRPVGCVRYGCARHVDSLPSSLPNTEDVYGVLFFPSLAPRGFSKGG
jgi:hypothetical protein